MINTDKILETGIKAALESARIQRFYLGNLSEIGEKGEKDLVTKADLESERVIKETIKSIFPDHAILAEESGASGNKSQSRWIIDPLDGTTNFAHQLPLFCSSIAFEHKGEILSGVVMNPVTNELFHAVKGRGACLNGVKIRVSDKKKVRDSLLVTGFPYNAPEIIDELMARMANCIKASQGVRRLGSAALDLCYLACGRFEGFWEQNLKPWDTAAGFIIASEAGARITDFVNNPFQTGMNEILATNGLIHEDMMALLKI